MGKRKSTVSLGKHLSMRIGYVERIVEIYETQSRERDTDAEKTELERFSNLAATMIATSTAQTTALQLAVSGQADMATKLAESTEKSTERIVTRIGALETALLTGDSKKAGVEGWWTKARVNLAASIGFLTFIIGTALVLYSTWRG